MSTQKLSPSPLMKPNTVVVVSRDQVSSDLAGESVILNLKSGTYYGLNEVGSAVWDQIQTPKTISDLCTALQQQYDIDPQTCLQDVQELLADLLNAHLVEIQDVDR